jgi:diacylglycerol kinase (ATP)
VQRLGIAQPSLLTFVALMATPKIRIILNPIAGTGGSREAIASSAAALLPDAEVIAAERCEDLPRLAMEALERGCEAIVAAGGDGTLNGVLNGLAPALDAARPVRLGVLPLGTGNDFARTCNIPLDLEHALAVLREGLSRRIDVVRVRTPSLTRYMLNVSSGGFATEVSEQASEEVKDAWGRLGYARSLVGALPQMGSYAAEIRLDDGRETLSVPALIAIVANGRFVAGGVPIAPKAEIDDGLVDLVVVPEAKFSELAMLAPAAFFGRHLEDERILHHRARKIEIRSEPPMRFNTDGEMLPAEPITFEVVPGAIDFIVGPTPVVAG